MTMRKREEIEEESDTMSDGEGYGWEIYNTTGLLLEVLLDIRELLTPVQFEPAKLSDEEIRKVIEDWKKANPDA